MNDTPKKRPWCQFHLSTAIVLMLVAGVLITLNQRHFKFRLDANTVYCMYGFPIQCIPIKVDDPEFEPIQGVGEAYFDPAYWAILLDIAANSVCITGTWWLCEWSIRRRERQP